MRFFVFNVTHGSCALMVADNGNVILFDCGHDEEGFRPSEFLPANWRAVQKLVMSHYDHDHVSDLPNLRARMPIDILVRNPTIPAADVRRAKLHEGPLTESLTEVVDMLGTYTAPVNVEPDFAGANLAVFYNSYPTFTDMNNLSVVSFIEYDGMGIVLPGDIEKAGWKALLKRPLFREYLSRVNVFIASHHGRENGYCPEVFDVCYPEIAIISDTAMQYDTQENCYAINVRGLPDLSTGENRFVLTTRCDGHIMIEKKRGQGYNITTEC